jgi:hypothetical protein
MERIKSANTATALPKNTSTGTAGFFSEGNVSTGEKATFFSAEWCNHVQEELVAIATAAGAALNGADNGQCLTAISAMIAAAVNGLAPIANPTFTGTPTAPTAAAGTNTTQIASTAFVVAAIAAALGSQGAISLNSLAAGNQSSITLPAWMFGGTAITIKFGLSTACTNDSTVAVTFTTAFSTIYWGGPVAAVNSTGETGGSGEMWPQLDGLPTKTGMTLLLKDTGSGSNTMSLMWIAIGST